MSLESNESATSGSEASGTTEDSSDSTASSGTVPSEATGERAEASSGEEGTSTTIDLASVPKDLRPHVEKLAKKYEKDLKGAYTKKFQALGAKEREWEQERGTYKTEKERWEALAVEVLRDPIKYDEYRKKYGYETAANAASTSGVIPENIKTVGDFLDWQKQQNVQLESRITAKAVEQVNATVAVKNWDTAITSKVKDPHFAKYKDFILHTAKNDPIVRRVWNGANEEAVLTAAHERVKEMLREDMEAVRTKALEEQRRKDPASTTVPSKTMPTVRPGAKDAAEVVARVRARLGPPEASV